MKHFSLLIVLVFLCGLTQAQVSEHQPVLTQEQANSSSIAQIKHQFFISINGGIGFASSPDNANATCLHIDINGKYFLFGHLALIGKLGVDNLPTEYSFPQYLGGVCLMTNSKYSNVQVNFLSLVGLMQDNSNGVSFTGYYSEDGSGTAFYEGIEITHLNSKHICGANIGIDYLFSNIIYSNRNGYLRGGVIGEGILQVYLGISLHNIQSRK